MTMTSGPRGSPHAQSRGYGLRVPVSDPTAPENPAWRMPWTLATDILIVLTLALLKWHLSLPWHWPLFLWGLAIGFLDACCIQVSQNLASRVDESEPDERTRRRVRILTVDGLFFGVFAGMFAAMLNSWIPIILLAVFTSLLIGAQAVILARTYRKKPPAQ